MNRITGGAGPSRQATGVRPRPFNGPTDRSDDARGSYKEERYWRARRSLRIWPVKGPDLGASLSDFLVSALQLDPEILNEVPSFDIRRVRATRSKIDDEVCLARFDRIYLGSKGNFSLQWCCYRTGKQYSYTKIVSYIIIFLHL